MRINGRTIEITRMTAESFGNRIDILGTATAGNGPIDLNVDARLGQPEVLAAALPPDWRPSGSLAVSGTLRGSAAHPLLAARVSGSGLDANGIVVDSLDGNVTVAQGVLTVSGLRLTRGEGSLRLEGSIDRRMNHMRISGHGEKLAVSVRTLTTSTASCRRRPQQKRYIRGRRGRIRCRWLAQPADRHTRYCWQRRHDGQRSTVG